MNATMNATLPPARLSREDSQKLTRDRLLEAGRRLFITRGYGGTSLRDIATEAGYSQGAFYSNFASKEALLLELLKEHMALKMAQLEGLFDTAATAEDLMAALEHWASGMDAYAEWSVLAVELRLHANRSAEFATAYAPMEERHRTDLARLMSLLYQRCGKVPPDDTPALAEALIALADGMALNREGGRKPPVGAAMTSLIKALLTAAPDA